MLFGLRRIFLWRYVWKCRWTFEILPWNKIRSLPCLWLFRDGFCRRHGAFFSWTERRSLRVGPFRWTVGDSCWNELTCITYDTTLAVVVKPNILQSWRCREEPLTKGQERNRSQLYSGPTVSHPSWTLLRKGLENEGRRETTDTIRTQHNGKRKERNNETMVIEKQEKRRRNSYAKSEPRTALPGDDALQTSGGGGQSEYPSIMKMSGSSPRREKKANSVHWKLAAGWVRWCRRRS